MAWQKEVMRFEQRGLLPTAITSGNQRIATHLLVSDLAMVGAIFGVIGARIFHLLEYPREFMQDPFSMIFSRDWFSAQIYENNALGITIPPGVSPIPLYEALAA